MDGPHKKIRFVETLGRGGFGTVYLADAETGEDFPQRLAIKILSAEMTKVHDAAARQRDEARLLAQISHDNIVKVFELIDLNGQPAVLMEYVDGVDASQLIKRGPLPPRAATQVIAAAASALEAAYHTPNPHTGQPLRVVHRDIKPGNLLISRYGEVKVLDFGIARADFDREGKTNSVLFGTARYMAPEQWLHRAVSPAVDVYALGITFVELLTATHGERAPLDENSFSAYRRRMLARLSQQPLPAGFHEATSTLIGQMLSFDPEDRPSAKIIHDRLLAIVDQVPEDGLPPYAAAAVPPIIAARREYYADDPLPDSRSFYEPIPQTTGFSSHVRPPVLMPESVTLAHTAEHPPSPQRSNSWLGTITAVLVLISLNLGGLSILFDSFQETPSTRSQPLQLAQDTPTQPAPEKPPGIERPLAAAPNLQESIAKETPAETSSTEPPTVSSRSKRRKEAPPSTPIPPPAEIVSEPIAEAQQLVESVVAPPPASPTRVIGFGAHRFDILVTIDGQTVGQTPVEQVELTYGTHLVEMEYNGQRVKKMITVGATTPQNYTWEKGSGILAQ